MSAAPFSELVLATHNPGKLAEMRALVGPLGVRVHSAAELALAEPEETAGTFAGNAALKAEAACAATGLPALADDSGLAVAALGGAPGVYSARWAGPERDFTAAMARVLDLVTGRDRGAAFVCVLALAVPDGPTRLYEGRVEGAIAEAPRGTGFGYDPIFVPVEGDGRTFGEMSPDEKAGTDAPLSHRARAIARFRTALMAAA